MSALVLPPTPPPTSTPSPSNSLRCTSRRDSLPLLALQLSTVTIAVSSSPSPVSASHVAEDGDLPYPTCDIKRVRFPCPVGEAERFASTHITYSPSEYDRTPILISEEGRSCALPERGSKRCYSYTAPEDVPADLASYPTLEEDVSSEDGEDGSDGSGGSVSLDEEEVMDRRIAMMRSLGLAGGGGGGSPVLEGGYWEGEGSEEGEGHVEFSTTTMTTTEVVEEEDGEDELMRIRERCRTRFGMWRVETAEFAAEDPNACNSPREPCTPNPSPMSPPSSLERFDSFRASSSHSPIPPPQMSYFNITPSSAPIAIPFRSASGSSSNAAESFDSPASATPTSSFVTGLAVPHRSTRTKRTDDQGEEEEDDDDDDDSPASLGAASPATRRMLWCRQMKLRCLGGRSSPVAQTSSAVESDVDDEEEECRDEGRGMRRWLSFDDRIVSDSPPPTPAWDESLPSVRSTTTGFPVTAPTTVSTSLPNVIEGGFELPSTPLTMTSFGRSSLLGRTSIDTLLSSTSTSTATPVDSTPTSSTSPCSTVQQQPSPITATDVPPAGGLTVLSSPSSSACSSSDTGSFSTDSDPPSLDSLLDDDRWGVELERSPCFRDGGKLDLMSLCEAGERGGFVVGAGGW